MVIDTVNKAIWHLRRMQGYYISRRLERYVKEELEEDLFPYGFSDGNENRVLQYVQDFVDRVNAGEVNIYRPLEERILERYVLLREEHLSLLAQMNRMMMGVVETDRDDDRSF